MMEEVSGRVGDADRVLSPSATEPVPVSAHPGDAPSRDPRHLASLLTAKQRDCLAAAGAHYEETAEDLCCHPSVLRSLCEPTWKRPAFFYSKVVFRDAAGSHFPHSYAAGTLTKLGEQVRDVIRRDSDEQPQAEDPKGLSGEAMPARAEGIAQPSAPQPSGAHK